MRQCHVKLLVIHQDVPGLIDLNLQVGCTRWRCVYLNHALVDVLLHVHWQLVNLRVGLLDFEIKNGLLTLHFALRLLITDLKLRNPDLFLSRSVVLLLSEWINRILYVFVHVQKLLVLLRWRLLLFFVRQEDNQRCAALDGVHHEYFTELRGASFEDVGVSDSDEPVVLFVNNQLWRVHCFESAVVGCLRNKECFKWVRELNFEILIRCQSPYSLDLRQLFRLFKLKSCPLDHAIEPRVALGLIILDGLLQIGDQPLRLILFDIRQFG